MKINPNNFFKRELDILPPHFVNMVIEQTHDNNLELIRSWIYQNCSGRFSITKDIKVALELSPVRIILLLDALSDTSIIKNS